MEDNSEKKANKISLIKIKLHERTFGVYGQMIEELTEVPNMTKIPGAPDYLRGVVPRNKRLIPVVDLRIKLGFPKTEFTVNTCLLICNQKIHEVPFMSALLVDAVHGVDEFERDRLKKKDQEWGAYTFDVIQIEDGSNVLIINMDSLFSPNDLDRISFAIAEALI
jgi:purine-binding chemotaxis protein CheW